MFDRIWSKKMYQVEVTKTCNVNTLQRSFHIRFSSGWRVVHRFLLSVCWGLHRFYTVWWGGGGSITSPCVLKYSSNGSGFWGTCINGNTKNKFSISFQVSLNNLAPERYAYIWRIILISLICSNRSYKPWTFSNICKF